MNVYVVVFDPQGSMGGFDWFYKEDDARACLAQYEREGVPVLGMTAFSVGRNFSAEEITAEIDAELPETEHRLGYVPPTASERIRDAREAR